MRILALEFSSHQRSVALLQPGQAGEFVLQEVIATDHPGRPLGMIEEVLESGQTDRKEIDRIVVGLGPGSYGGIRSAISLAQGWHLALGTGLSGISSVEVLAATAYEVGLRGPVSCVIDAQRSEFYRADYQLGEAGPAPVGKLRIVPDAEICQLSASETCILGSQILKSCPGMRVIPPRAAQLAKLALAQPSVVAPEQLEPIYLRETQFVKAPPARFT